MTAEGEIPKPSRTLIEPYGGELVDRFVSDRVLETWVMEAGDCRLTLSDDDLVHLYNLAAGCYSPLTGFMTEAEYKGVIGDRGLPGGVDWTIPVLLHAQDFDSAGLASHSTLALIDVEGQAVAVLDIESVFEIDLDSHSAAVFGTTAADHPGVRNITGKSSLYVGGAVHVGANRLRTLRHLKSPAQTRDCFRDRGGQTFTAFSTRNICHIGHQHLHELALERSDLLGVCVITGAQVKGSFLPDVVFDTYEHLLRNHYPKDRVFLLNLRLPPIYAGPNEAFLQATILQNLGFTHFIVGRDHAGIGVYYPKYGSQKIFEELDGLAIEILAIPEPRYSVKTKKVATVVGPDEDDREINGRDVRRFLLERRFEDLAILLNPGLRTFLTRMVEGKTGSDSHQDSLGDASHIFHE